MGIIKFEIVLDNTRASYCAGTVLTGRILLRFDKPKKVRGIKLIVQGKAAVCWERTEPILHAHNHRKDHKPHHKIVSYYALERYINKDVYLEGGDHCKITMGSGYEHVYPFAVDLPQQLPTSFEGKHGYIRYSVKVRLVRPWIFDVKEKMPFTVVSPLDLNYHPSARLPVNIKEEKTFFTPFSSSSSPLVMLIKLPQRGFIAGQDIPVTIDVINDSNIPVDSIELKVVEVEHWTVHHPRNDSKFYKKVVVRKNLQGLNTRGSVTISEVLHLGYIPLVNIEGCSIINISFYLKVKAHVASLWNKGLSVKIPIVIGTVPHQQELSYSTPDRVLTEGNPLQQWLNTKGNHGANPNISSNPGLADNSEPPPYSVAISMPAPFPDVSLPHQYMAQPQSSYNQPIYPQEVLSDTNNISSIRPSSFNSSHIYPTAPFPDENDKGARKEEPK